MSQFAHEFPGPEHRFRRDVRVAQPDVVASLVGGAFQAMAAVMRPLAIDMELSEFDPELGLANYDRLPSPFRAVGTHRPSAVVIEERPERVEVASLEPEDIEIWLRTQLIDGERTVGIVGLTTTATEAWAADPAAASLLT